MWPGNLKYVSLPEKYQEFFERDSENNNCICDKGFKSCVKPKGKGLIARYRKKSNHYERLFIVYSELSDKDRT